MFFIDTAVILENFKTFCHAASHVEKVANSVHIHTGKCIKFCP